MQELITIARELHERADQLLALAGAAEGDAAPPSSPPSEDVPEETADFFDDYGAVFDFLRTNKMLGPTINDGEFEGCDRIIGAFAAGGAPVSYCAYALATAYLETAHTMQPVKEIGGAAYYTRMYDIRGSRPAKARELGNLTPGDGAKYCGRGYVQLTGKTNYVKATSKLQGLGYDADLVRDPDRAMEAEIAAVIMFYGMTEGWFTSRKLADDLPADGPARIAQFVASRDIINGRDKQDEIAVYANDFQTALQHGGYRQYRR